MKKLLFLSAIGLLAFAAMAQAQEAELVRYGVEDDSTAAMQQLRQGQSEEGVQARVQTMDGSGEMIQARIQEKIQTMQARKTQLRESLKNKTKLQEKQQLLREYKANEVSEFVKGINNRTSAQSNLLDSLAKSANGMEEKINARVDQILDDTKREKAMGIQGNLLQRHAILGNAWGELTERRAQLAELKENEDWQELRNQMDNYRSFLQEMRDELKAAIEEGQTLEDIIAE